MNSNSAPSLAAAEPGAETPARRGRAPWLFMILIIGTVGFFVFYPWALLTIQSFNVGQLGQPFQWGLDAWRAAFDNPGIWSALGNTFKIFFAFQLISFPVAIGIAWVLARTNVPWSHGFEFLFWMAFFMPTLASVFGWIILLDGHVGIINQLLKKINLSPFEIYSFWGMVWVHIVHSGIPAKVMLLTPMFRRMDAALEEAGRMSGAGVLRTFWQITLRVMTPGIMVVLLLASVRVLDSFEIELILGTPINFYVYSTRIVNLMSNEPPLIGQAAALGSVTLVVLLFLLPLQRLVTRGRSFVTITGKFRPNRIDLGTWRYLVCVLLIVVVLLILVVPVLSVVASTFMTRFGFFNLPNTWTLDNWRTALGDPLFLNALKNTLILAGTLAIVGPLLFSLLAYVIARTKWPLRGVLDTITWLPTTIPNVLAGLAVFWVFIQTPLFKPLYGTLWPLFFILLLSGVTLSIQLSKASFMQLSMELEEAARMAGASWWTTYRTIVLPIFWRTMVQIGSVKFMFAATAAGSIILVATQPTQTLSLVTLNLLASGLTEAASVNVLVIIILVIGVALIGRAFGLKSPGEH